MYPQLYCDQKIPMEMAFKGPKVIKERLGRFDPRSIAEADEAVSVEMASTPPAIHRFPGSMAKRVQELARFVVEHYDGDVKGSGAKVTASLC